MSKTLFFFVFRSFFLSLSLCSTFSLFLCLCLSKIFWWPECKGEGEERKETAGLPFPTGHVTSRRSCLRSLNFNKRCLVFVGSINWMIFTLYTIYDFLMLFSLFVLVLGSSAWKGPPPPRPDCPLPFPLHSATDQEEAFDGFCVKKCVQYKTSALTYL